MYFVFKKRLVSCWINNYNMVVLENEHISCKINLGG